MPPRPAVPGDAEGAYDACDAHDAVILAGGAARRLGGADKPGMVVGGRPLIATVAAAVPAAGRVVIVGPPRPEVPGAVAVREEPPGSGPVAALRAGLAEVTAPWTVLLAADLPFLRPAHVAALLTEARASGGRAGAVLVDEAGRDQWLAGAWRTVRLRTALSGYAGAALRGLLAPLDPVRVGLPAGDRPPWYDCDTTEDLTLARRRVDGGAMLEDWIDEVCRELGLDRDDVDRDLVLDLAKDVAHGVARPAAPLTAYLLGLAVGAGRPARDAAARITDLAAGWRPEKQAERQETRRGRRET
ncbi:MAG TPA: NTP transferase domain-containing protein [Streptosporangiaceae bacterium]|nr:NTP transferase domain-containing protein [Streptosporangiaceae bacterium]